MGRGGTRRAAREAADRLAELDTVWAKGTDAESWLRLREHLGRLSVRLRMAGVPASVVRALDAEALLEPLTGGAGRASLSKPTDVGVWTGGPWAPGPGSTVGCRCRERSPRPTSVG